MIVVSDTTPLNYLILVDAVHVLPVMFGKVIAPQAVIEELQHAKAPNEVRIWANQPPDWLEIRSPSSIISNPRLGKGEAAALALAHEIRADAVLIDERIGTSVARGLGLSVATTLGVLELAAIQGLISLPATIAKLRSTTFHAKPTLLEEMLERERQRQAKKP